MSYFDSTNNTNFEDLRLPLMDSHNTQAITHAGYAVALIIAIATLLSSDVIKGLYEEGKSKRFLVYLIFGSLIGVILFFFQDSFLVLDGYWSLGNYL